LLTDNKFAETAFSYTFPIMFVIFAIFVSPLLILFLKTSKNWLCGDCKKSLKFKNGPIAVLTILLDVSILFLFIRSRSLMGAVRQDARFYDAAWSLNTTYLPLFILFYFILFYFIDAIQWGRAQSVKFRTLALNFFRVLLFGIIFLFMTLSLGIFMEIVLLFTGGGGVA